MKEKIFVLFAIIVLLITGTVVTAQEVKDTANQVIQVGASVKENILGDLDVSDYISAFIFATMGLILRQYFIVSKSVKKNPETPHKFSLAFWIKNNLMTKLLTVTANIIMIYVCLRFSMDWFGSTASMGFAFILGLCFDWFFDFIKKMKDRIPVTVPAGTPGDQPTQP